MKRIVILLLIITSCEIRDKNTVVEQSGEELSKQYCGNCHQYPKPELLDKASWEQYMLPRMGYMLGIYDHQGARDSLIEEGPGGKIVEQAGVFPKSASLDPEQWKRLKDFYLKNAPEALPQVPAKNIKIGLEQFEVLVPEFKVSPPSTTFISFIKNNHIQVGDAFSKSLLEFDADLNLLKKGTVEEGVVWVDELDNYLLMTVMGSFSPTDNPSGMLMAIPEEGAKQARVLKNHLRRPVHTAWGDLDGDSITDAVICEFGKWTGRLSLLWNRGKGDFEQEVLLDQSGATKAYIRDMNDDGLLDIVALFAQGNEVIYVFYNQGEGQFKKVQVLQFSPSHGSSFFDLFDYNGDGYLDIIYTAGDNADFHPVMKPYHGVYIFQNEGQNQFEQVFFYQLNGAYGAIPGDFDGDGDIDIATISFFPDYEKTPEESFVYLKNDGSGKFSASTFENNTMGRWIVMDAQDYDEDGDIDLILGSLAFEVIPDNGLVQQWVENGIPFVVLRNRKN